MLCMPAYGSFYLIRKNAKENDSFDKTLIFYCRMKTKKSMYRPRRKKNVFTQTKTFTLFWVSSSLHKHWLLS